ncbi:DUF3883 domain-containing protein [Sphingobacterium faecium]|uniref:DUF3883 domain-containing protein n=1 Tax=Sphingobacterium faecium TaxID=34087 RepID=UPI003208C833
MKEKNNFVGLYVSYYLARFNEEAYVKLGYASQRDTHINIGEILNVKPATIKNWRDEFDPLFGHRAGWYQRPMSKSRLAVVNALADLDESAVYELVKDILSKSHHPEDSEMKQLENIVSDGDIKTKRDSVYVPRGITGRAAEEYFIDQFKAGNTAFQGQLKDCRDLGVGYDFLIESKTKTIYVEVKGRDSNVGGLLFTNKEWEVAKRLGESYYVCLISDISDTPQIQTLQNPAAHIEAEKYVYTTIQVSWTVSQKIINEAFR